MTALALARPTRVDPARGIAALAEDALRRELEAFPKPGLVSLRDSGSHADMTAETFRRGIAAIGPFFDALAAAGAAGRDLEALRAIGRAAEHAMLQATGGINTHRGAIFGLGLLCAAAGAGEPGLRLGSVVARRWGAAIRATPASSLTHGAAMRRRYAAGGAAAEAAAGFPTLYDIGLPTLLAARRLVPDDPEAPDVACCFALIANLVDTNLLYRGGTDGLRFAQREAARFLDEGGVGRVGWRERAEAIHRAFVRRNLSPGGSADLLAMSIFVAAWEHAA